MFFLRPSHHIHKITSDVVLEQQVTVAVIRGSPKNLDKKWTFVRHVSCISVPWLQVLARLIIFTFRKQCKENRNCKAPAMLPQEFQEVIVLYKSLWYARCLKLSRSCHIVLCLKCLLK